MGKKITSIYSPVSPSDTYVIYDQFHFYDADHLERPVKGRKFALETYKFLKQAYPDKILGLSTIEYYKNLKESIFVRSRKR